MSQRRIRQLRTRWYQCLCRHAENRPDVPHSLANHGWLPDDIWEHEGSHCGHPAVEYAGLVAGVQAAGSSAAFLPSPQARHLS